MPPIDAPVEALRREGILRASAAGERVDVSAATLSRWRRAYAASGLKGLEPDYSKCGRKPLAVLDEWEQTTAKRLYVQTGSVTTALRLLANSESCSEQAASAILKKRTSKHTLTRSLRSQVEVPKAVVAYAKSPKNARTNFFICPRTLTYRDALNRERPLLVGDLSERDDMSNNFIGWVEWPWGGDPCSNRYGVRIARGQCLLQIDVRSLFFQSFCYLGQSYRDHFVPTIGERWERGIWASNKLRGVAIEPGHTTNAARLGGLASLGRRVIESQSPTTKIIENRFNFFQTVSSTIPGQIGRSRGEMERENKLWTECRAGRRDPREHFLSFAELGDQIEKKLHYVNAEPVEGLLYQGIPAEIYARGVAERRDELVPLAPEQGYIFSRTQRDALATKGTALVRYTRPDGTRGGWWFGHQDLYRWEGESLAVYFDDENPAAGATVVPKRVGLRDAQPLHCALIDGCPQFTLSRAELDPAMREALDRRKGSVDAVRSEYRALGFGQRLARVSSVRDGEGRSAEVTHLSSGVDGHATKPVSQREASDDAAGSHPVRSLTLSPGKADGQQALPVDRSRSRNQARPAHSLTHDPAHMRRLEEEFARVNPGAGIT
jgi:hypothetical protein